MLGAILILVGSVAAGVGLMVFMRARSGGEPYFVDSGAAGGVFGAVRGPVAVLLAFVIFLAFQGYIRADVAARNEASAVLTMSRTTSLFPPANADFLQVDMVCYARAIVHDEWPAMRHGEESEAVDHWLYETEQAISKVKVRTPIEQEGISEFFLESNEREVARDDRLSESDGVVPTPVWIVLIIGGAMVVGYVAFFANPHERLLTQGVMIGTTVTVIVSGLLLVAFFDHPFADRPGALEPIAMESTLRHMEEDRQSEPHASEPPCNASGIPNPED